MTTVAYILGVAFGSLEVKPDEIIILMFFDYFIITAIRG